MIVRPRTDRDLPELVALLARTHAEQQYPVRAENVRAGWVGEPDELGSWVADDAGAAVAHVALHPVHGACASLWRDATGRPDEGLAVVSRLFSGARGAGSLLLGTAVEQARGLDREPVLEVWVTSGAHGFYLRRGWREVGRTEQRWGHLPVTVAAMLPGVAVPGVTA